MFASLNTGRTQLRYGKVDRLRLLRRPSISKVRDERSDRGADVITSVADVVGLGLVGGRGSDTESSGTS